jgi:hypothetical protein
MGEKWMGARERLDSVQQSRLQIILPPSLPLFASDRGRGNGAKRFLESLASEHAFRAGSGTAAGLRTTGKIYLEIGEGKGRVLAHPFLPCVVYRRPPLVLLQRRSLALFLFSPGHFWSFPVHS